MLGSDKIEIARQILITEVGSLIVTISIDEEDPRIAATFPKAVQILFRPSEVLARVILLAGCSA